MDFGLSPEQEAFQRSAKEFLEKECPPPFVRALAREPDAFSRRLHARMAELGWTGLIVPETFGGLGLGYLDMALLLEELGRAAVPCPFLSSSLLATVALRRAPAKLKKRWLPAIAAGEAIGAVAVLEESDRLDGAGIAAQARPARGGFELSGKKLFVMDAAVADFIVAPFRTSGKGENGITVLLVPRDTPGLEITRLESVDITRPTYEVAFRRAHVPAEAALGPPGKGWTLVSEICEAGALGIAADCLGGAQRMLDMAVEYSKVRVQFAKPIGSFQAVKHMAAEMVADLEPSRSLVWYAAHMLDAAPRQAPLAVAMAKARLGDVYVKIANLSTQIHGGIGFTWEHDLHFWFKRAVWNQAAFGDSTYHRDRVATFAGFSG